MTVYAIALLNIADRERYGAYQSGFMEIFGRFSGKLLAVGRPPSAISRWPLAVKAQTTKSVSAVRVRIRCIGLNMGILLSCNQKRFSHANGESQKGREQLH